MPVLLAGAQACPITDKGLLLCTCGEGSLAGRRHGQRLCVFLFEVEFCKGSGSGRKAERGVSEAGVL